MKTILRASISFLFVFTLVTGILYPVFITLAAQAAFPGKANGSLLFRNGKPVGSLLIGQEFKRPEYFWGRLSATGAAPYNAMASGGTNFGALHPGLVEAAQGRIQALRAVDSGMSGAVPMDLATASGSGLDPDISLASAEYQAGRVAEARGIPADPVRRLVLDHAEERFMGFSGIPRVNVLRLNLALDSLSQTLKPGT